MGWQGRDERAPVPESSGLGGRSSDRLRFPNSLLLIGMGLWMRERFMEPYANAALDRLVLMLEMKAKHT